jgi:hypothetical protein
VIFVDLDTGRISADDADTIEQAQLPRPLRDELQARLVQLQRQAKARSARLDNAALAEAVLRFMVDLLGPYRQHVRTSSTAGRLLAPSRGELHPVRLPLEHWPRGCNPEAATPEAATPRGCNHSCERLQPPEAATTRVRGCNPQRLQPLV